ncbi:MAG: imidazole glycerol phosphate synthase subunit HisH [Pseudomonadota bacterium]
MTRIAIIDYGMGNLHSIAKALDHVAPDAVVEVTDRSDLIHAADRVVFPGVGGIGHCMEELRRHRLVDLIRESAAEKPTLGICLGLQALLDHSEENGGTPCLGVIPGEVRYFGDRPIDPVSGQALTVPHMGWNNVQHNDHPLWDGIDQGERFYFVHSYYADPREQTDVAGTTDYGRTFSCAVARDKLFAVQFHPEKSADAGLHLLKNFVAWNP